jgi:hypothetical protein
MGKRRLAGGAGHVCQLIVEKEVRFKIRSGRPYLNSAKRKDLINLDIPLRSVVTNRS